MSSFKDQAIINYYARLIQKGAYSLEMVPSMYVKQVKEAYDLLPAYTPREGEFKPDVI